MSGIRSHFILILLRPLLVSLSLCSAKYSLNGSEETNVSESDAVTRPIVILIGIDGLRWDVLDRLDAHNLKRMVESGIHSGGLIPQFPTDSFVNLYTIVTGLYPVNHGIVGNFFYDPDIDKTFYYQSAILETVGEQSGSELMGESEWWGGEPVWITAEKQGKIAATFFWVGSDAMIDGISPSYFVPFNSSIPHKVRVNQIHDWLDLPPHQRPDLITLYFDEVDIACHIHGVGSSEEAASVRRVDGSIGTLLQGLENGNLAESVNVIVVSDHGFVNVDSGNFIYLDDFIDLEKVRVLEFEHFPGFTTISIYPNEGLLEPVYKNLQSAHPKFEVYLRDEIPPRFHNRNNPRVAPIVALASEGWVIGSRKLLSKFDPMHIPIGMHGYDPKHRSMHGFFTAFGPAFPSGVKIQPFENIHIYELISEILGLVPAPNDGDREFARSLLKKDFVSRRPIPSLAEGNQSAAK